MIDPAAALLVLPAATAALLLLRSAWEKQRLRTESYLLKTPKLPAGERIRLAFLSDLHSASFGPDNSRLLEAVDALSPDAVLIGGDMITCGKTTQISPRTGVCTHLIERLCAAYPVYYAEGNHEQRFAKRFPLEYNLFRQHLCQTAGLVYLGCEGRSVHVSNHKKNAAREKKDTSAKAANRSLLQGMNDKEGCAETKAAGKKAEKRILVRAVPLDASYYKPLKPGFGRKKKLPSGELERLLGTAQTDAFQILMLHSPMYLKEAAAWGADLVLSGHFHGGTVRLPLLGGVMTPQYQFFVRECAGLHYAGTHAMIVSRGLGTHSIRVRINNLPELSCIDICGTG